MRTVARVILAGVLAGTLQACASVPKEAVELSTTVGRDLDAVHRAHLALLDSYFQRMESDINAFVDGEYRPYCIARTAQEFDLIGKLQGPQPVSTDLDQLDVLEAFVEAVVADIEGFRSELLEPIRKQHAEVRNAVEEAYRRIQDAQAIVTGHLASVRRVHDLHEEILATADLQDLPNKVVSGAVGTSESIERLTAKARRASGKADEFNRALEELKKLTASLKHRGDDDAEPQD